MKSYNFLEGEILLINKPLTWTSFDVVNKIRYHLKRQLQVKKIKVGHTGTLDPLATGLLILCTGKATKKIENLLSLTKEYTGIITLGATTPSYDLETKIDATFSYENITEQQIIETAKNFIGTSEQLPPIFSAKKVNGEKAYDKARKGEKVELTRNSITIYEFEITAINLPDVEFRIVCSKGTYIRSIAYDFGRALNNGGHLSKLCRTKVGEYHLNDAQEIDEFIECSTG